MAYIDDLKSIFSRPLLGDNHYVLTQSDIDDLQSLQYAEVQSRYMQQGWQYQTVDECKKRVQLQMGDALVNIANRNGTFSDPSQYTYPVMPVMMGAGEASAVYAGGGLPASIIDRKAEAMVLAGANFEAYAAEADGKKDEFWSMDKLKQLQQRAWETGFNEIAGDAIRDAFLYGGSLLYPMYKNERYSSLLKRMDKAVIEKDAIKRWVGIDRWNTVYVPSFNPTAADYLLPKTIMVCQDAVEISTTRCCLIKPKPMPYWSAICNMGWSPSDITGWIQAYYAYETTQQAIPIMAQQMSLLLYRMPLEALNATVGVDQVKKLMEVNEEQMKNWSVLSPKAVNMIGEVETVERTYSGIDQLYAALKADLAAQCEIPEPSLWHTPNKGFSDNTQESLIKQSEALQMRQHYIERYLGTAKDLLVADVWGSESQEWERRNELRLTFDKPQITTEKDLADVGAKFAASINSYVQAGLSPDTAMQIARKFYPTVDLTDELLAEVRKSYTERQERLAMGQSSVGGKASNNRTGTSKPQTPNRKTNGTGGK